MLLQDDGTMDQDVDGDGAINLSTSQRPSAATTPNDSVHTEDAEQVIIVIDWLIGIVRRFVKTVLVIWYGVNVQVVTTIGLLCI